MNLLITGGAGFIGSNFIRHIVQKYDYPILNFDKLTYAGNLDNLKNLEEWNPDFYKGDISNYSELEDAISRWRIDTIVNFAAETHVDRSINSTSAFMRSNIIGVWVLLEIMRYNKTHGPQIKKFIQISTDEVYGSKAKGSSKEGDRLLPNSPYSASKASADLLCRTYAKTYKLPIIITRSSNNFGPYQYPEKLIPLFITNLIDDKKVPLYGDGLNVRDWLFVKDNCEAIDFILHHGKLGEIYNIGSEYELPNIEIAEIILEALNKDKSYIEYVKDRPAHDRRYSLDCKKLHKLGWKPKHKFHTAIGATIFWYKENENWWRKIKEGEDG